MKPFVWLGLVLAAVAAVAQPQPPRVEKGSPRELRGVSRVFVTVSEPERVAEYEALLAEALPSIEIVRDPAEADVMLVVTTWTESRRLVSPSGSECNSCEEARRLQATPPPLYHATASVVRPVGPDTYRQLVKSSCSGLVEASLAPRIVEQVAAAYRKANLTK
jgi:hypothetical protein